MRHCPKAASSPYTSQRRANGCLFCYLWSSFLLHRQTQPGCWLVSRLVRRGLIPLVEQPAPLHNCLGGSLHVDTACQPACAHNNTLVFAWREWMRSQVSDERVAAGFDAPFTFLLYCSTERCYCPTTGFFYTLPIHCLNVDDGKIAARCIPSPIPNPHPSYLPLTYPKHTSQYKLQ